MIEAVERERAPHICACRLRAEGADFEHHREIIARDPHTALGEYLAYGVGVAGGAAHARRAGGVAVGRHRAHRVEVAAHHAHLGVGRRAEQVDGAPGRRGWRGDRDRLEAAAAAMRDVHVAHVDRRALVRVDVCDRQVVAQHLEARRLERDERGRAIAEHVQPRLAADDARCLSRRVGRGHALATRVARHSLAAARAGEARLLPTAARRVADAAHAERVHPGAGSARGTVDADRAVFAERE
jgi:hypothetical protein